MYATRRFLRFVFLVAALAITFAWLSAEAQHAPSGTHVTPNAEALP